MILRFPRLAAIVEGGTVRPEGLFFKNQMLFTVMMKPGIRPD